MAQIGRRVSAQGKAGTQTRPRWLCRATEQGSAQGMGQVWVDSAETPWESELGNSPPCTSGKARRRETTRVFAGTETRTRPGRAAIRRSERDAAEPLPGRRTMARKPAGRK